MSLRQCSLNLLLVSLLLAAGCGEKSPSAASRLPEFSASSAAQQAIGDYDSNKDGQLDGKELDRCPALLQAIKSFDADGNGKLSEQEIANRLGTYKSGGVAMFSLSCSVSAGNNVLPGATVTFVPEKFMGPGYKPATGISDETGSVELQIEGESVSGIYCGLYRVVVTKKNSSGKEQIPANYNTQTTLGYEIAPDMRIGNIDLHLSLR